MSDSLTQEDSAGRSSQSSVLIPVAGADDGPTLSLRHAATKDSQSCATYYSRPENGRDSHDFLVPVSYDHLLIIEGTLFHIVAGSSFVPQ